MTRLVAFLSIGALSSSVSAQTVVNAGSPRVSPDGTQVLFQSNRDGKSGVCIMSIDGSNARRLVRDAGCCGSWFPNGKRIVVTALGQSPMEPAHVIAVNLDGTDRQEIATEIYRMGADGGGVVRITR